MLHSLLKKNLIRSQTHVTTEALAEESMRLIIEAYDRKGLLSSPRIVKVKNLSKSLQKLHIKGKAQRKDVIHEQWILETGSRSLLKVDDIGSIHYSAMDVFCDSKGHLIVLIADHYHGKSYNSFRTEYAKLELPIHFILLGGSIYQADQNHCFIFSLSHLLLTASDERLYEYLKSLPKTEPSTTPLYDYLKNFPETSSRITSLPWYALPPQYNLHAQSFKSITTYVDDVKNRENPLSPEQHSETLLAANFDLRLSKTLHCDETGKIQNRAIDEKAIAFSQTALEFMDTLSNEELIKICYDEAYPITVQILTAVLDVEKKLSEVSVRLPPNQTNSSLFSLIFSNQSLLNFFFSASFLDKNSKHPMKLCQIFQNRLFIEAALWNLLDLTALFEALTKSNGKELELNTRNLDIAYKNIGILPYLLEHCIADPSLSFPEGAINELFLMSGIDKVFHFSLSRSVLNASSESAHDFERQKFHPFVELYCSQKIDNKLLLSIQFDKFETLRFSDSLSQEDLKIQICRAPIFKEYSSPNAVAGSFMTPIHTPSRELSCTLFSPVKEIDNEDDINKDDFLMLFNS